jgi:putative colanic acid biosynthesis acetyltransferase WcaF
MTVRVSEDLPPRAGCGALPKPPLRDKLARLLWAFAYYAAFRFSPVFAHGWRRAILRAFGAQVAPRVAIYPSARIWAPWRLRLDEGATVGGGAELYNVAPIHVGEEAVVSQYAYLCTASHDHRREFQLIAASVEVRRHAWVAAGCFIGPGVTIEEGAVAAARAVVTRSVPPWTVVAGNPARIVGRRPSTARNRLHGG